MSSAVPTDASGGRSLWALLAELGRSVPMPGGNLPIRSVMLHRDELTRAKTLAVEFPAGFLRAEPGYYDAGEEILVLGGELRLGDLQFVAGDWAWIPPGAPRHGLRSDGGATVYAWFSAGNDWHPTAGAPTGPPIRHARVGFADAAPGPLRGRETGEACGCTIIAAPGTRASGPADLLDLGGLCWRHVEPQGTVVVGPAPAMVRSHGASEPGR